MGQIGRRLSLAAQAVEPGVVAVPQAPELRQHEPDPVRLLLPLFQLGERGIKHAGLGVDEALDVEEVLHAGEGTQQRQRSGAPG
ncbi:hypothetical protein D9M68_917710 [compost metagenome]